MTTEPVLQLSVVGVPKAQGSMSAVRTRNGKVLVKHANTADLVGWRGRISDCALAAWGERRPLDEPIHISVAFWLPRPASTNKRVHSPFRRPDLDKLLRAALDSLTGIVFTDDARVCSVDMVKCYASTRPPGMELSVWPLEKRP